MAKKLPKNLWLWVVGILFVMSVMPGEGTKAASQQAIVATEYICNEDADCPVCVGGGFIEYNESDDNFLGELSYAKCVDSKCELSDACVIWECPSGSTRDVDGEIIPCKSVKQTILDNTIGKFNDSPAILLLIVGLVLAYIMLK